MTVELPKDAEGREIPLDITALYDKDGKEIVVSRWQYYPKVWPGHWNLKSDRNKFYRQDEVYLTKPDSWEKLEEDLGKIANNPGEVVCAYFGREISDCDGCKLDGCECACSNAFLRDVIERIRKLRGEDE